MGFLEFLHKFLYMNKPIIMACISAVEQIFQAFYRYGIAK